MDQETPEGKSSMRIKTCNDNRRSRRANILALQYRSKPIALDRTPCGCNYWLETRCEYLIVMRGICEKCNWAHGRRMWLERQPGELNAGQQDAGQARVLNGIVLLIGRELYEK